MLAFGSSSGGSLALHGFFIVAGKPEDADELFTAEGCSRIMSRPEAERALRIVRRGVSDLLRTIYAPELEDFRQNLKDGYDPAPEDRGPALPPLACLAHDAAMG